MNDTGQPHRSIEDAHKAVLLPWNETDVVRISHNGYHYYQRLDKEGRKNFLQLYDGELTRNHTMPLPPNARLEAFGGDEARRTVTPVINGMCKPGTSIWTEPLTFDEYEGLGVASGIRSGGGLRVDNSAQDLRPVVDSNGYVSFLFAKGMTIGFERSNFWFYPFQKNLMDISLQIPQSGIPNNRTMVQTVLCYSPDKVGFSHPMRGIPTSVGQNQRNVMFMLPYLFTSLVEPW